MEAEKIIRGKRVLVVEDEKDVIEVLVELLSVCKIDAASTFEEGKSLLESNDYDIAILDIMGVRGFDLLRVANERGIPALMLTAHGLSKENLKKSAEEGAAYYAPKDEMNRIALFVADVLDSIQKKKSPWRRLIERLGGFYDAKFGMSFRTDSSCGIGLIRRRRYRIGTTLGGRMADRCCRFCAAAPRPGYSVFLTGRGRDQQNADVGYFSPTSFFSPPPGG